MSSDSLIEVITTLVPSAAKKVSRFSYVNHGGLRSVRSVGRSADRIDRFDRFGNFTDFLIFLARRGARDLSCVKVSALYDAWRPKKRRKTEMNFLIFCQVRFGRFGNPFGSIDNAPTGDGGPP